MNIPASDASIPVLTQVLEQSSAPAAAVTAASAPCPIPTLGAIAGDEWAQVEREISERVLHQIQERVDLVLDHRIKDGVAVALQKVTEEITTEIRRGLQITLRDVIARAVAQEISRLQAKK
ncbi:MAG: hypothetical protein VB032_05620 [Burkholderiaceae bacterium]|nr:hypothetical protein [Burkholderiaceae bacterium]